MINTVLITTKVNMTISLTSQRLTIRFENKSKNTVNLLSKNKFSWSSAIIYVHFLSKFFTFVFSLDPAWKDLKSLKRTHVEKYIEHLHEYAKNSLKHRNSRPEQYVHKSLSIIQKFFEDIQRYEYEMAPETHVRIFHKHYGRRLGFRY
ncbi:hypothetical protein J6TS1_36430 [Siminovitchia terrae]|uniref:Uncharacterized protein n=1 Tax=Siminovitchia terrae TaxID=1914933 RepID=A0ABQ4L0I5_SIMTE|nr:hypothetical protein J6TS1_36430 [Siminovitchia terrae]